MHLKSLNTLEFDKIVRLLSGLSFSAGGRVLCERLKPVNDPAAVQQSQDDTTAAVEVILARGLPPMSGLYNIKDAVKLSLTGATLRPRSLLDIAAFLRAVSRLHAFLPEQDPAVPNSFYELIRTLVEVNDLEKAISRAILSEDEISDQASRRLADIRESIRQTQAGIRRRLESYLQTRSEALQEQLITIRNGRYVLPVKASCRSQVPGIVHDVSSTGMTIFVEPTAVVEANNKIRELEAAEEEEIERILAELSGFVAEQKTVLFMDQSITSNIDFVLAKARLSRQMKASAPHLNTEGRIELYEARHPLIPADQVVPIDLHIGQTFRTLVITGPNTGGKTVSLKTCGLLTLMTMAGLHIPAAEGSIMAVFDNVMADIGDEQSIEQSLSTFSSHMKNLVGITNAAQENVLILTDELGSGTDPSEGAALAISILDHLRERGATTIATTHYKELKAYAVETEAVENACCEFDTDTLEPTYRLLIGVPGVSNAFVISKKLGLNKKIIRAAKDRLSDEGLQFEALIRRIEQDRTAAAQLRRELTARQAAMDRDREILDRGLKKLREDQARVIANSREEARRALQKQLEATESLLKELREAKDRALTEDAEALRHELKRELNQVEGQIGSETLKKDTSVKAADQIRVGETYYSATLKTTGRVEQGPDKSGQYLFVAGALKIWVKADDLAEGEGDRPLTAAEKAMKKKQGGQHTKSGGGRGGAGSGSGAGGRGHRGPSKAMTFIPEVNLLGMTSDEAALALDRFVDEAVLANAKSLRVVHGKGSGVLRATVDRELKRDRRVKSHRLGEYGEGDSGVTIVELR